MKRCFAPARLRSLLLFLLVLTAQTAVLSHVEVDEGHPAASDCVLCIGLAQLGAAAPPQAGPVVFEASLEADCAPLQPLPGRVPTLGFLARGPPQAS